MFTIDTKAEAEALKYIGRTLKNHSCVTTRKVAMHLTEKGIEGSKSDIIAGLLFEEYVKIEDGRITMTETGNEMYKSLQPHSREDKS
jgi:predicted methyltransferase